MATSVDFGREKMVRGFLQYWYTYAASSKPTKGYTAAFHSSSLVDCSSLIKEDFASSFTYRILSFGMENIELR